MKVKRFFGALVIMIGVVFGFMGCNVENTAGDGNEATALEGTYGNCSANCAYVAEDISWILQYDLNGNLLEKYNVEDCGIEDFYDIVWVNEKWMYIHTGDEEQEDEREWLWRIPIIVENGVEQLCFSQKEQLVDYQGLNCVFYVANDFIVYGTADALYKLDLETKKVIALEEKYKFASFVQDINGIVPGEQVYFLSEDKILYRLDVDAWMAEKVYGPMENASDDGLAILDAAAWENGNMYFAPANKTIMKYNVDTKKMVPYLNDNSIQDKIYEHKSWENSMTEIDWDIRGLFIYDDRLYIVTHIVWDEKIEKQEVKFDEGYYMMDEGIGHHNYEMVFSCQLNGNEIKYEDSLSRTLDDLQEDATYGKQDNDVLDVAYYFYDTYMVDSLVEGKLILEPNDTGEEDYYLYDMKTEKVEVIKPDTTECKYFQYLGIDLW